MTTISMILWGRNYHEAKTFVMFLLRDNQERGAR
jgi:hypothetical protein